jgi:hypothetical protein
VENTVPLLIFPPSPEEHDTVECDILLLLLLPFMKRSTASHSELLIARANSRKPKTETKLQPETQVVYQERKELCKIK